MADSGDALNYIRAIRGHRRRRETSGAIERSGVGISAKVLLKCEHGRNGSLVLRRRLIQVS